MHCASWKIYYGWNSQGCEAKDINLETKQLICECKHLSSFAGFSTAPINKLNPFYKYKLFLERQNNYFVIMFVICLLVLYFILLFFALWRSNKDRYKQCVIYLEDNIPHDKFPYLVVVYTGARFFTGTTSNVGIVIEGEDSVSRPHILRSSRFQTLQRGDDNWFIMYTPYNLGKINLIQIWMDYSGKRPEWYLYKIIVIDITAGEHYQFLINTWVSLRFGDAIEIFQKVHEKGDIVRKDLIDENVVFGFREAHVWISVLSTHPRSALNTSQRLSVAFTGLFVVMLVSCIFYGALDDSKEEDSEFSMTQKQMLVGAIGLFIIVILIAIIVTIFRKSLNIEHTKRREDLTENNKFSGYCTKKIKNLRYFPSTCWQSLFHKTHRSTVLFRLCRVIQKYFLRKKKFVPVHCDTDIVSSKKFIKTYKKSYIAYAAILICISIIIVCSLFIIKYALKFGKVKCLEWLSSIVLSLTQDIFIISPLKILLFTIISITMYSKLYDVVKYDINWERVRIYKKHLLDSDPELELKLSTLRTNKIYVPLSYKELLIKQNRQDFFDAIWLLIDISVIGLLVVMLIIQSNTLWTTKFYWNNYNLLSLLRQGYKEGYGKSEIKNVTHYLPFLKGVVFPLIYQTIWYNGQPIKESDEVTSSFSYIFDGAGTLLGTPRIRQLRLKPGLCKKPIYNGLPFDCPSILTKETLDTSIYGEVWKSGGRYDFFQESSVWDYQNSSETFEKVVYGYTSMEYEAGGYVSDLSLTQIASENIIRYLEEKNWLDEHTMAIIFEITTYNPNTGTISWLIAITERLHIGLLLNKIYVYTVDQQYNLLIIDTIVFISMWAFIIRLILVMNRRGIQDALLNFWNWLEIIIVFLIIYCATLYIRSINNMNKYFAEYNHRDHDQYFKFLNLIKILSDTEVVFILMFVMVMCRFMKSWQFGVVFDRLFCTLWSAWESIIWVFMLMCLLIFLYCKKISYLLNEFVHSRTFFLLIHKMDFKHTVRDCPSAYCKVSLYVWCVVSNSLLLLIVIHYLWCYRDIKNSTVDKEILNLCTVFSRKKERTSYIVHRQ